MGIRLENRKWGMLVIPNGVLPPALQQRKLPVTVEEIEREQEFKELADDTDFPTEFILAVHTLLTGQQDLRVVLDRFLEDDEVYRVAPSLTRFDAKRMYERFYPRQ